MPPHPPHELLLVRWLDTGLSMNDGWGYPSQVREEFDKLGGDGMEAESVGWLIFETDDVIAIAGTRGLGNDQFLGTQIIHRKGIIDTYTYDDGILTVREHKPREPFIDAPDDMCPNCVTPWKCNGPHIFVEDVA